MENNKWRKKNIHLHYYTKKKGLKGKLLYKASN